ncbi:hypothetical protein PQQ96_37685 [Paraburkholderia sediminicola]|uniref:hypothetical protein n=1 Tax=Paraburkholderia sediminicola TaxID=458836 RepID=UPI0038B7A7EA
MIRSGLPNIDSGNPNRHFGKSNNRYGTPALLFDFNRNACSSSSEKPVRLQPKSLFGFAEIRTKKGKTNHAGQALRNNQAIFRERR